MRNLLLSFAGALICHLLLFLSPLVGQRAPVALSTPHQGGGILVHLRQDLLSRKDIKYTLPSPLLSEPRRHQAEARPEKRHTIDKAPSPRLGEGAPVVKKPRQNTQPALQGAKDATHCKGAVTATERGVALKNQEKREEGASATITRAEALPLWDQNVKPLYPPLARKRGWQGTVLLEVMVGEDGTVGTLLIHTSSGHRFLDTTALKAVRKWVFMAAQKRGVAVPSRVLIPIHFTLDNATLRENT